MLKQTEVNLRAEIDRLNRQAVHADKELKDKRNALQAAESDLREESSNIRHLAVVMSAKLEQINAMEQQLQSAACIIRGYGDRVQFAAGRITMIQVTVFGHESTFQLLLTSVNRECWPRDNCKKTSCQQPLLQLRCVANRPRLLRKTSSHSSCLLLMREMRLNAQLCFIRNKRSVGAYVVKASDALLLLLLLVHKGTCCN